MRFVANIGVKRTAEGGIGGLSDEAVESVPGARSGDSGTARTFGENEAAFADALNVSPNIGEELSCFRFFGERVRSFGDNRLFLRTVIVFHLLELHVHHLIVVSGLEVLIRAIVTRV